MPIDSNVHMMMDCSKTEKGETREMYLGEERGVSIDDQKKKDQSKNPDPQESDGFLTHALKRFALLRDDKSGLPYKLQFERMLDRDLVDVFGKKLKAQKGEAAAPDNIAIHPDDQLFATSRGSKETNGDRHVGTRTVPVLSRFFLDEDVRIDEYPDIINARKSLAELLMCQGGSTRIPLLKPEVK